MSKNRRLAVEALETREMLSVGLSRFFTGVVAQSTANTAARAVASRQAAVVSTADYGKTFQTATPISLLSNNTASRTGRLDRAYDADMFSFKAPASGTLTVRETAVPRSGLDSFLYVYDSSGKVLKSDDGPGTLNSRVVVNVTAGSRYFVKAAAFRQSKGDYRLDMALAPNRVDDFGNDFDGSTRIALSNDGAGTQNGRIDYGGDADMFRVVATTTGRMTVRQIVSPGSKVDPYVYIYDGNRQLIWQNDDSNNSLNSRVEFNIGAGGTYYIKAAAHTLVPGAYSIAVSTISTAGDDFPDTIGQATPITFDANVEATQFGRIERAGDVDMFVVTMPSAVQLAVEQLAMSGNLDPHLYVYDSTGKLLAENDNSGTLNSSVLVTVNAGDTVYIAASETGQTTGAYRLQISTIPLPDSEFNIGLRFAASTNPADMQAFEDAAARWEKIITGDLLAMRYGGQWVDDILIDASTVYIDGPSGILGQAGPDAFRPGSHLPYHGIMQFDAADTAQMRADGWLTDVITHEMGHVLGFGTIWDRLGLIAGATTATPTFIGPLATAEYNTLFGKSATGVPIEPDTGFNRGSALSHWAENWEGPQGSGELMTPYLSPLGPPYPAHPISSITVASLADLGYTVDMTAAEPFTPVTSLVSGPTSKVTSNPLDLAMASVNRWIL